MTHRTTPTGALGRIGELRAATTRRERARILLEERGSERYADLLAYAQGCDPDVLSPSRLVNWAEYGPRRAHGPREGLAWMGESAWELRVCGVVLATHETPGVEEALRRWATRPGWYALDLWETSRFARSPEGAVHREAPRRCLEVVDAYRRGEATREQLAQARAAAYAAAYAAHADAAAAADASAYSAAAYAAHADAAYAAHAHAARAAAYAAHAAAHAAHADADAAAAYAAADAAAYSAAAYAAHAHADAAERQRWHEDWRWHLLWHASRGWA